MSASKRSASTEDNARSLANIQSLAEDGNWSKVVPDITVNLALISYI
jgi:hypothetical protein